MKPGERVRGDRMNKWPLLEVTSEGIRKKQITDLGDIPELETIKKKEKDGCLRGQERRGSGGSVASGGNSLNWKLHLYPTDVNMSTQRGCTQANNRRWPKSGLITVSSRLAGGALHLRTGRVVLSAVLWKGLKWLEVKRHVYFTNFPDCLNISITSSTLQGKVFSEGL